MAEEITVKELPEECWGMIFNNLDSESDWESISLVCKTFLSITNSIRVSLKVFSPSVEILSNLLQRFRRLKKIQLHNFPGDLNKAVVVITQSGLNLEELDLSSNEDLPNVCLEELGSKMKNLKVLNCSGSSLKDSDLVRIGNSFPQLEELQIRNSYFPHEVNGKIIAVTDEGIEFLSSKLKKLHKIDISGNQCISDESLVKLSSNCAFLEHITVGYSNGVTENGISFLINNTHHLNSLVLWAHFKIGSFGVKGSTNFPNNIRSLKFMSVNIPDEFLYSITKARIPLTELTLSFCKSFTFDGISKLVQSYQSLNSLVLLGAEFLTNEHVEYLSRFLHNLTSIKLLSSPKLSDAAFVTLTQRCQLLSQLVMGNTSLGKEEYNYHSVMPNFAIKHLDLSSNPNLSTSGLKKLLTICPKVEKLSLFGCFNHKEQLDVADILECNKGLVNLVLTRCRHIMFSRKDAKISKLETVVAQDSGINDEVLAMLVKICPRLVHLNLEDCNHDLTQEGVMEVVKSCQRLRYLSLNSCSNVDSNIIGWIVSNSPSLKRLVSPSHSCPNEEQQKQFLQQGCFVTGGTNYEELH